MDDDESTVLALTDELTFEGFETDSAGDGPAAIDKAFASNPDVILLDLELPGLNGFEVCRRLRARMPGVWIIIVSVRGQEVDRVMGLELGADDYVTKPFSLREIMARIKVGLRRLEGKKSAREVERFGGLEIDLAARRVTKKGQELVLTRREFDVLALLIARAGEVITRDEFLDVIWGKEVYLTPRVVDTHLAALRKKIEDDPANPRHILSVRGVGYRLNRNLTDSSLSLNPTGVLSR